MLLTNGNPAEDLYVDLFDVSTCYICDDPNRDQYEMHIGIREQSINGHTLENLLVSDAYWQLRVYLTGCGSPAPGFALAASVAPDDIWFDTVDQSCHTVTLHLFDYLPLTIPTTLGH